MADVEAVISDLHQINTWLDTKATQSDLSGSNIPAAVAGPFNDLNTKGRTLHDWTTSNCK